MEIREKNIVERITHHGESSWNGKSLTTLSNSGNRCGSQDVEHALQHINLLE